MLNLDVMKELLVWAVILAFVGGFVFALIHLLFIVPYTAYKNRRLLSDPARLRALAKDGQICPCCGKVVKPFSLPDGCKGQHLR